MASPNDDSKLDNPLLSPLFFSASDGNSSATTSTSTSSSSSSNSSAHDAESPRNDWWSNAKPEALDDLNLMMNFNFPGDQWGMDMDAGVSPFVTDHSHQYSIDPNVLHFGDNVYGGTGPGQDHLHNSMYQFSMPRPPDDGRMSNMPMPTMSNMSNMPSNIPIQQLPTPTAVSYSRSTSPELTLSNTGVNPRDLSLMAQLSQRAREAAGVTHAITTSKEMLLQPHFQAPITPVSPVVTELPGARLRPGAHAVMNAYSNTLQLQQQSLPPSVQPTPEPVTAPSPVPTPPPPQPQLTKSGRPKTSHTTIERRYRTNLNARILALRRAVPALRILEKGVSTTQQGKGLTGACAPRWDFNDVMNERGFVDGVKAAKKNSKGVVLGKAVEYIKALKRRELRLTRETNGLKSLISGLVGGPELLQSWEYEWHAKFGGEEADEVDEEAEEEDDDEGGEGEDDDDDDDGGTRGKKRTKIEKKGTGVTAVVPTASAPNGLPVAPNNGEKRKRGRPRKVQTTDADVPRLVLHPSGLGSQQHQQKQKQDGQESQAQRQQQQQAFLQPQPSKYLLAAFALFNFFNTVPSASYSSAHTKTHTGSVLNPTASAYSTSSMPHTPVSFLTTWTPLQMLNTIVSVLLLACLVSGYLPQRVRAYVPGFVFAQPPVVGEVRARAVAPAHGDKNVDGDYTVDEDLTKLDSNLEGTNSTIGNTLEECVSGTLGGLVKAVVKRVLTMKSSMGRHGAVAEVKMLRSAAEEIVLRDRSMSLIRRAQVYLSFSPSLRTSCTPPASASQITSTSTLSNASSVSSSGISRASDQITLALLALPFSTGIAERRWKEARQTGDKTAVEKLVLTMGVEEAAEIIKSSYVWSQQSAPAAFKSMPMPTSSISMQKQSPAQYIASYIVGLRTKAIAARRFVECVNLGSGDGVETTAAVADEEGDQCPSQTHNVQVEAADQASSCADDCTVLQAGKELGGKLAVLAGMIEKCATTTGVDVATTSPIAEGAAGSGTNMTTIIPTFAHPYFYELSDILEESESDSSSESEEGGPVVDDASASPSARDGVTVTREEDIMERDAKLLVIATILYRSILSSESAMSSAGIASTAVTSSTSSPATNLMTASYPKSPAMPLILALRRALASTAFELTPETEDARDRIVDVLADMGRGAGRMGIY